MPGLPEREQAAYEQLQNSEEVEGVSRGAMPAELANGRSGQNVMIQGDETSDIDAKSPEGGPDLSTLMLAPADRTLRQTKPTKLLHGGLCFTPDGGTLIHGGSEDMELSLWDLRTAKRAVGLTRTGSLVDTALSPDGSHMCVAARDGLGMYSFPCSAADEPLWDAEPGTAFCDAAFSRDGKMVASVREASGLVEIRDVASSEVLHVIENFPSGGDHGDDGPGALSFSDDVLAIAGRNGEPNAKQVRLLSLRHFTTLKTLELTSESKACMELTFDPSGTRLAVAMGDHLGETPADLLVCSEVGDWDAPPLRLGVLDLCPGQRAVTSVGFSNDGRLLCAGFFPSGTFALWDAEAGVCVRIIAHPETKGHDCGFSPADDLLATGGGNAPIVLHELRPLSAQATFELPGHDHDEVSASCASPEVVVLASGSRLVVVTREDQKVLWEMALEAEVGAAYFPLALQPTGEQVACCLKSLKTVSVHDARTGVSTRSCP